MSFVQLSDLASRLRFLGCGRFSMYELLENIVRTRDNPFANGVVRSSRQAGYISKKHAVNWTPQELPDPEGK